LIGRDIKYRYSVAQQAPMQLAASAEKFASAAVGKRIIEAAEILEA